MSDLIDKLREYASTRKGELAELITEAADALGRPTCDDAVSRQAVIDALDRIGSFDTEADKKYARSVFEALPSAQPEPCEDVISRRRLLSDLKELTAAWKKYPVMAKQIKGVEAAIGYVETIPSAQPERKKGTWIINDNGTWSCDQCNSWIPNEQYYYARFCLYCGAKMDGSE